MEEIALVAGVSAILLVVALVCKPTRKALGVVICFCGIVECLSCVGVVIGLPTMFIGALLIFV